MMLYRQLLEDNPPPAACGVYIMRDVRGQVLYVGKAVNLKNRVFQYVHVQDSPRVRALVKNVRSLEYLLTGNEVEALLLEAELIKEYQPRYNIRLKDDKAYPYIRISKEDFPCISFARRPSGDARYFGPYTSAQAVRRTIKLVGETFGIRSCRRQITKQGGGVPCLNYHIGMCSAPCAGRITQEEYNEAVEHVCALLSGNYRELLSRLEEKMRACAGREEFERAAKFRDQILAVRSIAERQHVATGGGVEQDVLAVVVSQHQGIVEVLQVRGGRLIGKREHVLRTQGEDEGVVLAAFIEQYYQDNPPPDEILTQWEIPDRALFERWLSTVKGRRVRISTPRRGRKRELVLLAERNAGLCVEQKRLFKQEEGLVQLQEVLGLEGAVWRVEAFDISHLAGTGAVASMVVFRGGVPDKASYRRYRIKTVEGVDDPAMIREVVARRYRRLLREGRCLPDLILVDGGAGQVRAAHRALSELGLDVVVVGLSKGLEQVHRLHAAPLRLPENSPALRFLQRVRDEAHCFALSYQQRRRRDALTSQVMDIPGVGEVLGRRLLAHFKSLDAMRRAGVEELVRVPGVGESLAAGIVEWFERQRQEEQV